jgi:hypothetical protein
MEAILTGFRALASEEIHIVIEVPVTERLGKTIEPGDSRKWCI